MDRAQIQAEWDKFIEYPSDDKRIVTTTSALLFAEHIAKLQATQAEPMFWVRLRSDGGYEGPIHNAVIEDVRRMSGAWHPLYLGSEPVQAGELPDGMALVVEKLQRFQECSEDSGSGGCDIGRDWFDALTTIGLLRRVQRSPGLWEMTSSGSAVLARAALAASGRQE